MAPKKEKTKEATDLVDTLVVEYQKDEKRKTKLYSQRAGTDVVAQEIITTSSFIFDAILGGGFRASSWSRFYADPECGKTSLGLRWGKNWQDKFGEEAFVIYFNAEGRLTKDLLDRSEIDTSRERFRIIDTNSYDIILSMTEKLFSLNSNKRRYFIMIDSLDACELDGDKDKGYNEADKVAGGSTVMSRAGKKLSLLTNITGNHIFISSQVRAKMNTQSPQGGGGKSPSGGNAPKFYSSLTGEIKKPWSDTYLYEDPSDKKSKIIGRMCEIKLEKTPNEKSGVTVVYPVKYGLKGGVWRNYEAFIVAQSCKLIAVTKSWNTIEDSIYEDIKSKGIDVPQSFQEKTAREIFDSNPALVEYVFEKASLLFSV